MAGEEEEHEKGNEPFLQLAQYLRQCVTMSSRKQKQKCKVMYGIPDGDKIMKLTLQDGVGVDQMLFGHALSPFRYRAGYKK